MFGYITLVCWWYCFTFPAINNDIIKVTIKVLLIPLRCGGGSLLSLLGKNIKLREKKGNMKSERESEYLFLITSLWGRISSREVFMGEGEKREREGKYEGCREKYKVRKGKGRSREWYRGRGERKSKGKIIALEKHKEWGKEHFLPYDQIMKRISSRKRKRNL